MEHPEARMLPGHLRAADSARTQGRPSSADGLYWYGHVTVGEGHECIGSQHGTPQRESAVEIRHIFLNPCRKSLVIDEISY